ncbi:MAG: hypothetical protein KatS3mg115_1843 [Candidatus Poribacteria bacterium]|nr:MAG: hypothetical protein KatS3mg115_1843 [Candidatus Poribacteria bacterium]
MKRRWLTALLTVEAWIALGALAAIGRAQQVQYEQIRDPDTELSYSAIMAGSPNTLVLIGEDVFSETKATVAVTNDGGQSWTLHKDMAPGRLLGGFMLDDRNGWVVGEAGTVLATRDGGTSWDIQTSKVTADLYDAFFLDAQRGWAVGENSTVISTTNGGRTWRVLQGGQKSSEVGEGAVMYMGVHFFNERNGIVVGAGEQGVILKTTDGGQTWSVVLTGSETQEVDNFFGLAFADAQRGWAVGKYGELYATTDGGQTWTPQNSGTEEDLFAVSAADANTVWISGVYGTIAYTTDGGQTWNSVPVQVDMFGSLKPLTVRVPGIVAIGKTAWATTDFGRVLRLQLP